MLKALEDQKPLWKKTFEQGERDGFDVLYIRENVHHEGKQPHHAEVVMQTPYTYQGEPLLGYGIVELAQTPKDELRFATNMELWTTNESKGLVRNVADIADEKTGSRDYTVEQNGQEVKSSDAFGRMGNFAAAASEYPHVMTMDEYLDVTKERNERLHIGDPTLDDYEKYIMSMQRQMRDPDIKMIGAVRKPEDCTQIFQDIDDVRAMSSSASMDRGFGE